MKTVLLFARDPGGANVILPVCEKLKAKYKVWLYAKEFALDKFRDAGLSVKNIEEECGKGTFAEIRSFLERLKPDIVITGTSLDDFTERYLWKAAKELGIKSFAILDQWMNLGIRFSGCSYHEEERYRQHREHPYLPGRIWAMDELARELLVKEGIDAEKITLTGQPHFDTVRGKFQSAIEVYDRDMWNVVFVSEPIYQDYDHCGKEEMYWGYNERTIFDNLYRSLEKLTECSACKIRLIIRPHPREHLENWDYIGDNLKNNKISVELDREHNSFSLMKSADLVCGMSSMFLLESMICERPVLSIMIGLKKENPFVLDMTGQCKSILSEEELLEHLLQLFFKGEDGMSESNDMEQHCAFGYPKGVENATDKIMQLVEGEMAE